MEKAELLEIIDSWENLPLVIREIGSRPDLFSTLMDIALNNPEQKTWRAAYLVEKIHDEYPELILPYIKKIIIQLENESNTSKKRHFLKLLSLNEIPEQHFGFLVNYCLEVASSDKEPPAVRVHAMQILFNISEKEPDLKPEILSVFEHEMEYHSTPGIVARGSKLAKKLRTQIQQKI